MLELLKTYLNISWDDKDDLLELLLSSSVSIIESYIWRKIEADDFVETFNWTKQPYILVRNYPIIQINEIKEWDRVLGSDEYIIEANKWKINFNFLTQRGFQNYTVDYKGWFDPIPWDLKMAIIKMTARYYQTIWTDWIKSETVNWDSLAFDTTEIASDIKIILNNYRDINV